MRTRIDRSANQPVPERRYELERKLRWFWASENNCSPVSAVTWLYEVILTRMPPSRDMLIMNSSEQIPSESDRAVGEAIPCNGLAIQH